MAVIDFHSHVLPGMDDGSKSVEMSLAMLHAMKAGRTDLVVASSHYYGHKESIDAFLKRRAHACANRIFFFKVKIFIKKFSAWLIKFR